MPDIKVKGYSGNEFEYENVEKVWLTGRESTRETLLAEQEVAFAANSYYGGLFYADLSIPESVEIGKEYYVAWDGTEHVCTAAEMQLGTMQGIGIGNPAVVGIGVDSGEPFLIGYMPDYNSFACLTSSTDSTHTVAIYKGSTGAALVPFAYGELLAGVEITPDFSTGDQQISVPDGSLVKEATILKPDTLLPENIVKGVKIAGVVGDYVPDTEEVTVELDMSEGDQTIEPSEGKLLSKATVKKPETLVPENIAKDVMIAGILGTHDGSGGGGATKPYIEYTLNDLGEVVAAKLYGFTSIPRGTFAFMPSLISVDISESPGLTSIGHYAFYTCSSLTSITIPDSVTSIGEYAFYGCSKLTSITIPDSVTSIGYCAFYGCSKLTSVTIGNGVTSISGYAFYNCTSLTSITIPDSVTSIGEYAFYGCSKLTSITIPDSVTSIGQYAFNGTSYYNTSNKWVGNVLYIGTHLVAAKTSISGALTIKDGTKHISGYAFYNCTSLTSITIPDSVTSIDNYAFYGCSKLTSVTIGNGVTSISGYAFYNCTSLTSITIPDSVTSIGYDAFYNCTSLTSITIPDSVTSIGEYAFYGCSKLTSITIPNGVTSIGNGAFYKCTSLTSITIPNGVTSISGYAFYGCSKLTSITIPDSVTSIGYGAFYNCTSLTSITIPNDVTSIGSYAFYNCTSLTSITIPDSVTSIGNYAFYGCSKLTSVTIGNGVTSISGYAFYNCTSLTSAEFKETSGWYVSTSSTATSGTNLSSSNLANASTAASYLKSTYYKYYWFRNSSITIEK